MPARRNLRPLIKHDRGLGNRWRELPLAELREVADKRRLLLGRTSDSPNGPTQTDFRPRNEQHSTKMAAIDPCAKDGLQQGRTKRGSCFRRASLAKMANLRSDPLALCRNGLCSCCRGIAIRMTRHALPLYYQATATSGSPIALGFHFLNSPQGSAGHYNVVAVVSVKECTRPVVSCLHCKLLCPTQQFSQRRPANTEKQSSMSKIPD